MPMQGRFDKYDPVSGGFRAPLAAAILAADKDKIYGVSINSSGLVVIGGGGAETGIIGVICAVKGMAIGDMIDVMTHGEIVHATWTVGTAFTAGQIVTAATAGTIQSTTGAGFKIIGRMIELDRMIVRCPISTT